MSNPRRSKGRQKIEMKKMSNESNLQVTFSKRRSGLFKKASELCTLCGAEVALVVFSPGDKVFSFGHPNVDGILDRFLTQAPPPNSTTMQIIEAHRTANVRDLNAQLTQITNQLEVEKKRAEELNRMRKATQAHLWWAAPIDEMTRPQLEQLKMALEDLNKNVTRFADKLLVHTAANSSTSNPLPPPPPQMFSGPPPPPPMPMLQFDPNMNININMNMMRPNMPPFGPAAFY